MRLRGVSLPTASLSNKNKDMPALGGARDCWREMKMQTIRYTQRSSTPLQLLQLLRYAMQYSEGEGVWNGREVKEHSTIGCSW